jgi:hypothetical protein
VFRVSAGQVLQDARQLADPAPDLARVHRREAQLQAIVGIAPRWMRRRKITSTFRARAAAAAAPPGRELARGAAGIGAARA